jgi:CBS domain-containing protein
MKVQDIMTANVRSCRTESSLATAAHLMLDNNCGFVPVVDDSGIVIGVLTDRDVCLAVAQKDRPASAIKVDEMYTRTVYSCEPADDIHVALHKMEAGKVRRLPVIGKEGRLRGIVSMTDILLHASQRGADKPTYAETVGALKMINTRPTPRKSIVVAAE